MNNIKTPHSIIDLFPNANIVVIGDLMLDHFLFGEVTRISPEAPIPVVRTQKEAYMPGGAANVAENIKTASGNVSLFGILGKDDAGSQLSDMLAGNGINTTGVLIDDTRTTTQKTRIVANGQQIVRIDKEDTKTISAEQEIELLRRVEEEIQSCDLIVLSDYNKGVCTQTMIQCVIKLGKKYNKRVVGDIKPLHVPWCVGIYVIAPNKHEAFEISSKTDTVDAGKTIQDKISSAVLITEGEAGMTLFEADKIHHFSAHALEVFDVAGAGDTVTAILALSLASGADLYRSVDIANHAAGIVVGKSGVATVSIDELKEALKDDEIRA